ncbi:MAG: vWA domain-containing protein [Anaerolineales bacterium]
MNTDSENNLLIGIAVDLSGSMKQSIHNETGEQFSRIQSFRKSLDQLVKEANDIINKHQNGKNTNAEIFIYAFGLQDVFGESNLVSTKVSDLLTFLKIAHTLNAPEQSGVKETGEYKELESIAKEHSLLNNLMKDKRILALIQGNRKGARNLANRLRNDPEAREKVAKEVRSVINTKATAKSGGFVGNIATVGAVIGFLFLGLSGPLGLAIGGAGLLLRSISKEVDNYSNQKRNDVESAIRDLARSPEEGEDVEFGLDDTTLSIEKLISYLGDKSEFQENFEEYIYAETPMKRALGEIEKRFDRELKKRQRETNLVLFMVSDGMPTDGDPRLIAQGLREKGITIISCFVTDNNVANPKILFSKPSNGWGEGAKLMFDMASPINKDSSFGKFLLEKGWQIEDEGKLFVQVNHSEVMEEFIRVIVSPLEQRFEKNNHSGKGV